MPVSLQFLQSFAGITDISRFKVGADNQLETRSAAGAFFRRVGDAFLRLSQSGRASIAARNENVMKAVTAAVKAARSHAEPEVRTLGDRLHASSTQLQQVVRRNKSAVLTDMVNNLCSGRAYSRLPAQYQALMRTGLVSIANNLPVAEWKDNMESLRDIFLRPTSERADKAEGSRIFGERLRESFLRPTQQSEVGENGIHKTFTLDTRRRNIDSIGGEVMPQIANDTAGQVHEPGTLTGDELARLCEDRLRALVGEEHKNLLPFITMMASQAGMDSAASFLTPMLGMGKTADSDLLAAGFRPNSSPHSLRIDREGDDLLLHTTFSTHFAGISSNGDQPVLSRDGKVTLRVHLAAAPEHVPVMMPATGNSAEQQRDVLIPQFTVENADVNYHLGGNQTV